MKKIHFANVLLICVLGTLILWPNIKLPTRHQSINIAYDSVCAITTGNYSASGVLLESGYILTAAHVVDRNMDGKIDNSEKFADINFPALNNDKVQAEVVISSNIPDELDVALLKLSEKIPLKGVSLISSTDYWRIKIGQPLFAIGMLNGRSPGNITDGRMIDMDPPGTHAFKHRNSANSYYGCSGGGVFIENKLIGISSAVGLGEQYLSMPVLNVNKELIGYIQIPYEVPMSNDSIHVPAPAIQAYLKENGPEDVLWQRPIKKFYEPYLAVIIFNLILSTCLFLSFKIIKRLMKENDE